MAIAYQSSKPHLLIPYFLIIMILFSSKIYCISEAEALLKFKSSLSNSKALDSWDPNTTPCKGKQALWDGVLCYEGNVMGLKLKSMGLNGTIDVNTLVNLHGLRTISLEDNKFTGPMPELNRLGALKAIYLTNNNFTGPISSDFFSKMGSLKKLWLANNSFTGDIPSSLAQLRHLGELHLENNHFSGMVPPLKQPPLVSLNLSNNNLEGEIPQSLKNFNESSFGGNVNLCGEIVGTQCTTSANENPTQSQQEIPSRKGGSFKEKIVIVTSLILVLLFLVIIAMLVARKKKNNQQKIPTTSKETTATTTTKGSKHSDNDDEGTKVGPTTNPSTKKSSGKGSKKGGVGDLTIVNNDKGVFGLTDLMKASAEVLGNGSMGSAYKAILGNGLGVVVKRMKELNNLEKDAFDAEMKRVSILRHKNVLPLLAYHYRIEEKLVIYEYVPKGSLHYILHGDRGSSHEELNWPTRLKIIKGITEGLSCLHSQLKHYDLPHGNLKSSNIMISSQNEPLLSDYGYSPLTNPSVKGNTLFGYRSPEAIQNQKASHKSDVYCLGVVILEILTCKFPSQYLNSTNGGTDVVQWVAAAIDEGNEAELIDPDIMSNSKDCKASMVKMLHIGANCTEPNSDKRPSLREVKERIDQI